MKEKTEGEREAQNLKQNVLGLSSKGKTLAGMSDT